MLIISNEHNFLKFVRDLQNQSVLTLSSASPFVFPLQHTALPPQIFLPAAAQPAPIHRLAPRLRSTRDGWDWVRSGEADSASTINIFSLSAVLKIIYYPVQRSYQNRGSITGDERRRRRDHVIVHSLPPPSLYKLDRGDIF